MELKKPLESIGWLSGSGYQIVIDQNAKREAEALRETIQKREEAEGPKAEKRAVAEG